MAHYNLKAQTGVYRAKAQPFFRRKVVAFDCDGTLIDIWGKPRKHVLRKLKWHQLLGRRVIVWSGGGASYATHVARSCGLENVECFSKFDSRLEAFLGRQKPDIAYDDELVTLGIKNIRV